MSIPQHVENYRADIDGLRAIAVLAVVGFHAFPTLVPGGFVGVDMFFVISGFLISEILLGHLERGTFSFTGFYRRRIKRLFPALLLVLAGVYGFGWLSLLSSEYRQLGKHIAGGALFVSNLVLWQESGYFDNAAATKPLLHLWSLGVEEQFYIVWPLILWFGARRNINLLAVIVVTALASFAVNLAESTDHPAAAFYSPVSRFWELMLGASLAYAMLPRAQGGHALLRRLATRLGRGPGAAGVGTLDPRVLTGIAVAGLALCTSAICFLSEKARFPGWWALLPTVGTLLIIAVGQRSWVNRVVLSNRLLVWLGLISYPLYLWHWPLFSFARIVFQSDPPLGMRVALVVLSILLAWLTFEGVEKPIRLGTNRVSKTLGLAAAMAVVAGAGLLTYADAGLPFRAVAEDSVALETGGDGGWPPSLQDCDFLSPQDRTLFTCKVDTRAPPSYALIGDSKAGALLPGLARASPADRTWLYLGSRRGQPLFPVLSQDPAYSQYRKRPVQVAIDLIDGTKSVQIVVIATAARALFQLGSDDSLADLPASPLYAAALAGLDQTVEVFLAHGKEVVLLMDNPTLPHMEDCLSRRTGIGFLDALIARPENPACRLPIPRYRALSKPYRDLLYAIESRHPGRVRIFDATDILCDAESGVCLPEKHGRILYGITDHLSDYGSTLVGTALNRSLALGAGPVRRP